MGGQLSVDPARAPAPDDAFFTALKSAELFNNTLVVSRGTMLTKYEQGALSKPITAEVRRVFLFVRDFGPHRPAEAARRPDSRMPCELVHGLRGDAPVWGLSGGLLEPIWSARSGRRPCAVVLGPVRPPSVCPMSRCLLRGYCTAIVACFRRVPVFPSIVPSSCVYPVFRPSPAQELALLSPPDTETRLAEVLAAGRGSARRGPPCKELHTPSAKSSLVHPDIAESSFFKLLKLRARLLNRSLESLLSIHAAAPSSTPGTICPLCVCSHAV